MASNYEQVRGSQQSIGSTVQSAEQMNIVVGDRYKLVRKIGQGSFGDVFEGVDLVSGSRVAVKLEEISNQKPLLFYEAQIFRALQSSNQLYVPKLYHLGQEGDYNVLVQQLLGPSLGDLILLSQTHTFSLWTVLTLGIEIVKILKFIHDRKYLHRDIKPSNFCMGQDEHSDNVYMIDYGLSKRYVHENTGLHIEPEVSSSFVGSMRYCSVNTGNGVTPSRRDDCESVLYMLAEFALGDLPWSKSIGGQNVFNVVHDIKKKVSPAQIAQGFPQEFALLYQYVRSLQFEDRPDYHSMIDMLITAKQKLKVSQSQFDWVLLATNPPEFVQLQSDKTRVLKAMEHQKGRLLDEEKKKRQQDGGDAQQLKPILGVADKQPAYLDQIDNQMRLGRAKPRPIPQKSRATFYDEDDSEEEERKGQPYDETVRAPQIYGKPKRVDAKTVAAQSQNRNSSIMGVGGAGLGAAALSTGLLANELRDRDRRLAEEKRLSYDDLRPQDGDRDSQGESGEDEDEDNGATAQARKARGKGPKITIEFPTTQRYESGLDAGDEEGEIDSDKRGDDSDDLFSENPNSPRNLDTEPKVVFKRNRRDEKDSVRRQTQGQAEEDDGDSQEESEEEEEESEGEEAVFTGSPRARDTEEAKTTNLQQKRRR